VTYHIDEILESDGSGGALLRSFQQDVSLVGVDFCDELWFVQNVQEVIPRYLTKSLWVILPSTEVEPKIILKRSDYNFLNEREYLGDQGIDGHFMRAIPLRLTARHTYLLQQPHLQANVSA
jgi:hypothetical protein